MNSSSHHGTETGSEQAERQEQPQRQHEQHQGKTVCLNTFDLAKIGVSSTLAVAVFILVGYVVRQIAGPSTILSVLIAALIAFLAGTFYVELNQAIVVSAILSKRLLSSPLANDRALYQAKSNAVSSEWLMPSYVFAYICNGEFAGFIIAWNLILEYAVAMALVSKVIVFAIDALIFDGNDFSLLHLVPLYLPWTSADFDMVTLLVPIVFGVPLLLILRRTTIVNVASIALTLIGVVIFLIIGATKADISNWHSAIDDNIAGSDASEQRRGTGGFYAFGVDGMFKGVAIILFAFIGFDSMVMSSVQPSFLSLFCRRQSSAASSSGGAGESNIANYIGAVSSAVLSINGMMFLCLLGMAFVLTTIQPYYSLHKNLPILTVFEEVFADGTWQIAIKSIILIMGIVALLGSLYALLHNVMRTIQVMLSSSDADDSTFKLFGKFEVGYVQHQIRKQLMEQQQQLHQDHSDNRNSSNNTASITGDDGKSIDECESGCRQRNGNTNTSSSNHSRNNYAIFCCLLCSLLSGLLGGLFLVEQLVNLLSIGTLLMLYALTIDIIILRYSIYLKEILYRPQANGATTLASTKRTRSVSLITTLVLIYCIVCVILVIFIKLLQTDIISMQIEWTIAIIAILSIGALSIVFLLGLQPDRNSLFEWRISQNPLFPAAIVFVCIYLCTVIGKNAWIRFVVWMAIGAVLYFILFLRCENRRRSSTNNGVCNSGYVADREESNTDSNFPMELSISNEMRRIDYPPSSILVPRQNSTEAIEMHSVKNFTIAEQPAMPVEAISSVHAVEEAYAVHRKQPSINSMKFDEIASAEDIRDICVERRDGTIYLIEPVEVDRLKSQANPKDNLQLEDVPDTQIEQKMIERVLLQQNEVPIESHREIPLHVHIPLEDYSSSETEEGSEVRAIVHASNDEGDEDDDYDEEKEEAEMERRLKEQEEAIRNEREKEKEREKDNSNRSEDEAKIEEAETISLVLEELDNGIAAVEGPKSPPNTPAVVASENVSFPSSESNLPSEKIDADKIESVSVGVRKPFTNQQSVFNDTGRTEFKERLERLFSQSDMGVQSAYLRQISLTHSISAPESLEMSAEIAAIKEQSTNANGETRPPPPPVFNQHLYNTIGRYAKDHKTQSPVDVNANGKSAEDDELQKQYDIEDNLPIKFKRPILKRSKRNENLSTMFDPNGSVDESNLPSPVSIRQRLEELFSKAQPPVIQRYEPQADENNNSNANDDDTNVAKIHRKKPIEPFDTVRKQKMLFSNVLKSIEADVFTNLHRTDSLAAVDIQSVRQQHSTSLSPPNGKHDVDDDDAAAVDAGNESSTETISK